MIPSLYTLRSDSELLVLNPSSDTLCLIQAALIDGSQAMYVITSKYGFFTELQLGPQPQH